MEFPKTLPFSMLASYATGKMRHGEYTLVSSEGDKYAFYQKDEGFGFKQGIEVEAAFKKGYPDKKITIVRRLTGNSWGKGSWLSVGTDYFPTMEAAIAALKADSMETAMTREDLEAWSNTQ